VGEDLSLSALIRSMVDDERSWKAVSSFYEQVMLQKEEAEKAREMDPEDPPQRRRRGGARRRAHARPPD